MISTAAEAVSSTTNLVSSWVDEPYNLSTSNIVLFVAAVNVVPVPSLYIVVVSPTAISLIGISIVLNALLYKANVPSHFKLVVELFWLPTNVM